MCITRLCMEYREDIVMYIDSTLRINISLCLVKVALRIDAVVLSRLDKTLVYLSQGQSLYNVLSVSCMHDIYFYMCI